MQSWQRLSVGPDSGLLSLSSSLESSLCEETGLETLPEIVIFMHNSTFIENL